MRARARGILEDLPAAQCHGDHHRATLRCFRNTGAFRKTELVVSTFSSYPHALVSSVYSAVLCTESEALSAHWVNNRAVLLDKALTGFSWPARRR